MITNSTRPIRPATSPTSAPVLTLPVWRAATRPSTKNPISHTRTSRIVLSDPRGSSEMMIWITPSASPARHTLFLHRNILSCESTEAELCSRVAGERSVLSRLTFVRGQRVPRWEKVPDAIPMAACHRYITYCYSPSVEESTAKQPGCLPSKEVFRGDHVLLRRGGGCATHAHGPVPGCDSWRPVSPGDA